MVVARSRLARLGCSYFITALLLTSTAFLLVGPDSPDLPLGTASAAPSDSTTTSPVSVTTPSYTAGDWFEYMGHDQVVIDTLGIMLANGSAPIEVDVNWSRPLLINYTGSIGCATETWAGVCNVATMTHGLNATLTWDENRSGYSNDTMIVNISLDETFEEPSGRRAFFTLSNGSIHIDAWFSAGGEDNHLEVEETWSVFRERLGDWPETIESTSVWSVEEDIDRVGERSTRVNGGPWNMTPANTSATTSWLWRSNGTVIAHTGNDSADQNDAARLMVEQVGGEASIELLLHPMGYMLGTTVYDGDTARSNLMLLNHSYRAEQQSQVVIVDHGIGPLGWLAVIAAIAVGFGLLLASIRVAQRAREVALTSSGMPRHVLESIAGAVGTDVFDEILTVTSDDDEPPLQADSEADQPRGILARAEQRVEDGDDLQLGSPSDDLTDG